MLISGAIARNESAGVFKRPSWPAVVQQSEKAVPAALGQDRARFLDPITSRPAVTDPDPNRPRSRSGPREL